MASIVYVGANDQAQEGTFKWLDNSPLTGPWGSLQPDNVFNQDCVVMEAIYGFKFNDVLCSNLYNFLCQTPVLTLADFCFPPYTYVSYLNICWRLNDATSLTWDAARDACIAENGDLLILHNDATINYIKDQLTLGMQLYLYFIKKFFSCHICTKRFVSIHQIYYI